MSYYHDLSYVCDCGCGKRFVKTIQYEPRDLSDNQFWMKFNKGIFILAITAMFWIFLLELMSHEYKARKMDMILKDPSVRFESTQYDNIDKNERSNVESIIREGRLIKDSK